MIINYLKLENFRQFAGEQVITFKSNPDKKVTLVIAESGFGKTTLIQSFAWIFYGECEYKSVLNDSIKQDLNPYDYVYVNGQINLMHDGKEYTISRSQKFCKIKVNIDVEPSTLTVEIKDKDGTTRAEKGRLADKIIRDLMPKDLFPYFFLEGENLEKVGKQMSKGKSGNTKEFVKAIRGLLGFNHLYETIKHLDSTIKEYNDEISKNSNDDKLNGIIKRINDAQETIDTLKSRLDNIEVELDYNTGEAEKLHEQLIKFEGVAEKQKKSKQLYADIQSLLININKQKNYIFKRFSTYGYLPVFNSLMDDVFLALENVDSIDKGIPGVNVDAIKFLLDHHKCICNRDLNEGSPEWDRLIELQKFLPPNNIGFEINKFKEDIEDIGRESKNYVDEFRNSRVTLSRLVSDYNKKVEEKNAIDEEISGVNVDVNTLKIQEQTYSSKIIDLKAERQIKTGLKETKEAEKASAEKEMNTYKYVNDKISRLTTYKAYAKEIQDVIVRFCSRKENEKRVLIEKYINEIFKDFYHEQVDFELDDKYTVSIKTVSEELSEDFASGGQQAALALSFIGAIINLFSLKSAKIDEDDLDIEEIMSSEVYPLILDAPTSKFGMKQMDSFAQIMPKITNQIIVFINDVHGPILKKLMNNIIDTEWTIDKTDTYHSKLLRGEYNGY